VLEVLGKFGDIPIGKEGLQIDCLGRVTANNVDSLGLFEGAGNFVARQKNRKSSVGTHHPLCEFALGMRIRSVDFVQN
jgi:hypothetical protein